MCVLLLLSRRRDPKTLFRRKETWSDGVEIKSGQGFSPGLFLPLSVRPDKETQNNVPPQPVSTLRSWVGPFSLCPPGDRVGGMGERGPSRTQEVAGTGRGRRRRGAGGPVRDPVVTFTDPHPSGFSSGSVDGDETVRSRGVGRRGYGLRGKRLCHNTGPQPDPGRVGSRRLPPAGDI